MVHLKRRLASTGTSYLNQGEVSRTMRFDSSLNSRCTIALVHTTILFALLLALRPAAVGAQRGRPRINEDYPLLRATVDAEYFFAVQDSIYPEDFRSHIAARAADLIIRTAPEEERLVDGFERCIRNMVKLICDVAEAIDSLPPSSMPTSPEAFVRRVGDEVRKLAVRRKCPAGGTYEMRSVKQGAFSIGCSKHGFPAPTLVMEIMTRIRNAARYRHFRRKWKGAVSWIHAVVDPPSSYGVLLQGARVSEIPEALKALQGVESRETGGGGMRLLLPCGIELTCRTDGGRLLMYTDVGVEKELERLAALSGRNERRRRPLAEIVFNPSKLVEKYAFLFPPLAVLDKKTKKVLAGSFRGRLVILDDRIILRLESPDDVASAFRELVMRVKNRAIKAGVRSESLPAFVKGTVKKEGGEQIMEFPFSDSEAHHPIGGILCTDLLQAVSMALTPRPSRNRGAGDGTEKIQGKAPGRRSGRPGRPTSVDKKRLREKMERMRKRTCSRMECAANMRMTANAYAMFVLDFGPPAGTPPSVRRLWELGYLRMLPHCPAGGTYGWKKENGGWKPSCSVHGVLGGRGSAPSPADASAGAQR